MHEGDEQGEEERQGAAEPPGATSRPPTERVRIVGAEQAGEATQVVPAVPREASPDAPEVPPSVTPLEPPEGSLGEPAVRLTGEPAGGDLGGTAVRPVEPGGTAVPDDPDNPWFTDEPGGPEPSATRLPHWTEAPTGQIPAVLERDSGDEGRTAMSGPTWREEHTDWAAHEEEFEPSLFGGDEEEEALGSLDETGRADAARRPWEFDLPSEGAPAVGRTEREPGPDEVTDQLPVVGRGAEGAGSGSGGYEPGGFDDDRPGGEPRELAPAAAAFGADPEVGDRGPEGEADPDRGVDAGAGPDGGADLPTTGEEDDRPTGRPRPTGTTRIGRVRRGGPRSRLRAKRPEDIDATLDTPLAAEPPGAAVTAVPGAGRRRGSLAGLAAADRTADLAGDRTGLAEESPEAPPSTPDEGDAPGSRGVAATAAGTLPRAHGPRVTTAERDEPLGGGPPAPRRPRDEGRSRDLHEAPGSMRLRVGTALIAAVAALICFSLGTVASLVLATIVVVAAAGECFGVLRRAGYHPATLLGLVGTISLMVAAYDKGPTAIPLVLVLLVAFTFLWYLLGIERGSPVAGSAATFLTVGWISLLGSYAALLLSPSAHPHREGIAFLVGAVIATVANDVGALVVGGWIGRRPLAPQISPNKTWEGLLGGTVLCIVVTALVVGQIHPWTTSKAALLGVVVSVVAPLGDLCESLLKRDLRLKDMGTLLPGHGGVLDRVDALLFVLPATYYLVRVVHLG